MKSGPIFTAASHKQTTAPLVSFTYLATDSRQPNRQMWVQAIKQYEKRVD
jgi:hypothetical protein